MELFCARQRRKFSRGIKRKPITVLKKLRKAPFVVKPTIPPESVHKGVVVRVRVKF